MAHATYADNQLLAVAGEGFATGVYEGSGYELLDTRVHTRSGEIDLIMEAPDGSTVFVEVKTRRGRGFGAAEAVTVKKLRTMRRCAAEWLDGRDVGPVRFDVAEVLFAGDEVHIEIFEGVDHGSC